MKKGHHGLVIVLAVVVCLGALEGFADEAALSREREFRPGHPLIAAWLAPALRAGIKAALATGDAFGRFIMDIGEKLFPGLRESVERIMPGALEAIGGIERLIFLVFFTIVLAVGAWRCRAWLWRRGIRGKISRAIDETSRLLSGRLVLATALEVDDVESVHFDVRRKILVAQKGLGLPEAFKMGSWARAAPELAADLRIEGMPRLEDPTDLYHVSVAYSASGSIRAIGLMGGAVSRRTETAFIWDATAEQVIAEFSIGLNETIETSIHFSRTDRYVAARDSDGLHILEIPDPIVPAEFRPEVLPMDSACGHSVAFSQDDSLLAYFGPSRKARHSARLIDTRSWREAWRVHTYVSTLVFADSGRLVGIHETPHESGLVKAIDFIDLGTNERVFTLGARGEQIIDWTVTPGLGLVAAVCTPGLVVLWDGNSGRQLEQRELPGPGLVGLDGRPLAHISLSPDGRYIAVSSQKSEEIFVYEVLLERDVPARPDTKVGDTSTETRVPLEIELEEHARRIEAIADRLEASTRNLHANHLALQVETPAPADACERTVAQARNAAGMLRSGRTPRGERCRPRDVGALLLNTWSSCARPGWLFHVAGSAPQRYNEIRAALYDLKETALELVGGIWRVKEGDACLFQTGSGHESSYYPGAAASISPPQVKALERAQRYEKRLFDARLRLVCRDWPAAESEARACVQERELDTRGWTYLGEALLNLDRPGDAMSAFTTSIKLAPACPAAHFNLGRALLASGEPGKGIASIGRALRLDAAFAAARSFLAEAGALPPDAQGKTETAVSKEQALHLIKNGQYQELVEASNAAVPALCEITRAHAHVDPELALSAVGILVQIGSPAILPLCRMAKQFARDHASEEFKEPFLGLLGKIIGHPAQGHVLISMLDGVRDPWLFNVIATAVFRCGCQDVYPQVADAYLVLLKELSSDVPFFAPRAFSFCSCTEVAQPLINAPAQEETLPAVLMAIAMIGHPMTPEIAASLAKETRMRATVARAFNFFATRFLPPALSGDAWPALDARADAFDISPWTERGGAVEALLEALNDPRTEVRREVALAMGRLGDLATEILLDAARSAPPALRRSVEWATQTLHERARTRIEETGCLVARELVISLPIAQARPAPFPDALQVDISDSTALSQLDKLLLPQGTIAGNCFLKRECGERKVVGRAQTGKKVQDREEPCFRFIIERVAGDDVLPGDTLECHWTLRPGHALPEG